jgi:hypothetical protein
MVFFYFLAALSCWFGIQSLLSGIRYAAYVRRETSRRLPISAVCLGDRAGQGIGAWLVDNLRPLLEQDYPRYEVLFVFDALDDPPSRLSTS